MMLSRMYSLYMQLLWTGVSTAMWETSFFTVTTTSTLSYLLVCWWMLHDRDATFNAALLNTAYYMYICNWWTVQSLFHVLFTLRITGDTTKLWWCRLCLHTASARATHAQYSGMGLTRMSGEFVADPQRCERGVIANGNTFTLGMWQSSNLTTFELRTFLADSKFFE